MPELKLTYNAFFRGPEGFKEHAQAEAISIDDLKILRSELLDYLASIGATAEGAFTPAQQPQGLDFSKLPPARPAGGGGTPQPYPSQMERAAREAFPGAQVQMECQSGCGPMRYVRGTAENGGKLSKRGLPYSSFWSCAVCKANVNI